MRQVSSYLLPYTVNVGSGTNSWLIQNHQPDKFVFPLGRDATLFFPDIQLDQLAPCYGTRDSHMCVGTV